MLPRTTITLSGLLEPRTLDAWSRAQQQRVRRGVALGMRDEGPGIAAALNAQVKRGFKTTNRGFTQQFKAKIYDRKPGQLPAMLVRSKVPWMGIYTRGGSIRGPLLIPLNQAKRMRTDVFRRIVQQLIASGNAFFKKINGKVLLFAEHLAENRFATAKFRRGVLNQTGGKRMKRGTEIPIAILVPRIEVKKRINLESSVRARLPALARTIEQRIATG